MLHVSRIAAVHCAFLLLSACGAEVPGDAADPTLEVAEEPLKTAGLTRDQERITLKAIDDICADTWCAGDYNFRFDRLQCSAPGESCALRFRIIPREGVPTTRRYYERACTTAGFTGFDSLIATASSGYQSLNWDYYLALTECITAVVNNLPRPE